MAFNQTLRAADFFVGLKIGFTYGKPSNITRLLTSEKETDDKQLVIEREDREREVMAGGQTRNPGTNNAGVNLDTAAAKRMLIDYSKGQIYTDGKSGQVIIINNYYYGNAAANRRIPFPLTVIDLPALRQQNVYRIDSAAGLNLPQRRSADSANRVLNDSLMQKREQLDSLIDRLYKLRQKLDSVNKTDNSSGYNNERNNNAKSLEGLTTTDDTTRLSIAALNDSLRSTTLTQDSMRRNAAQAARNEPSPKKAVALSTRDEQQNTGSSDQSVSRARDSAAVVFANSAMATRQQRLPDDAYEHYIRQSERLQADIVRLERQMINNRSFASTVGTTTANNRPVYTTQHHLNPECIRKQCLPAGNW
jgi:hypothetical protein